MQDTVSIWVLLCEELEAKKARDSTAEHSAAALKFEQAAAEVFKAHPGRLRDAYEIAGDVHQAAGEDGEARRCFEAALDVATPTQEQRGRLSTKLAMLFEADGDLPQALHFYEMAVDAQERGQNRGGLSTLLNNLAGLQRTLDKMPAALRTYQRALNEALAAHGPEHPEVALIANNFGVACTDSGDLVKAEELHLRALQVRETIYGANHPDVGQSLGNLAVVYHARGLSAKAERFYRGAIDTLSQFCGPDDPQLKRITKNYHRLPQVHARTLSKTTKI